MASKENGVVSVPKTYFFKMAKLDYNSWEAALPREFYQNSVDAGASLIEVKTDKSRRLIEVSDNGCGMDYETIKEKLLVLGGSKKATGNVGAFGKAKEILFFSWESYEIRTHDWLVTGEGAEYTIEKVDSWHEGTTCKIKLWASEDFDSVVTSFRGVASRFQTGCAIEVNKESIECNLRRKKLIRSMEWADVYIDEGVKSYYAHVRIDGQWMFSDWLSASYDIGQILLEIHGDSVSALTSNRDSLKGEYARKFRNLVAEFITDTKSALEPKSEIVREKFTGTGRVSVDKSKVDKKVKEVLAEISYNAPSSEIVDHVIDSLPCENLNTVDIDRVEETVNRVARSRSASYYKYEDRFKFIGFQPDFFVVYDELGRDANKVKRFMQGSNASKLANAWMEVLKQVLLDIEEYIDFNVGFDFSLKRTASYERKDGVCYFYLNPDYLLADLDRKVRWYQNRTLLREDLVLKAIHEVAHMWESSHNETFVLRSEWIRARTWKSISIYPKIIKECFATT